MLIEMPPRGAAPFDALRLLRCADTMLMRRRRSVRVYDDAATAVILRAAAPRVMRAITRYAR